MLKKTFSHVKAYFIHNRQYNVHSLYNSHTSTLFHRIIPPNVLNDIFKEKGRRRRDTHTLCVLHNYILLVPFYRKNAPRILTSLILLSWFFWNVLLCCFCMSLWAGRRNVVKLRCYQIRGTTIFQNMYKKTKMECLSRRKLIWNRRCMWTHTTR